MKNLFYKLSSHQGFVKYFKNISWLFFEKILRLGINFFVVAWIARYLGPEKYGLFSYAQSFVGLFLIFSTLGLDGVVVRELLSTKFKQEELMATVFWLRFAGAFLALLLMTVSIFFTSNDNYTNLLIFIIGFGIVFQSFHVIDFYFQSKVLSKYIVYSNLIGFFIITLIKIALILTKSPLLYFAIAILLEIILIAIFYIVFFIFYKSNNNKIVQFNKFKYKKNIAKELLKENWSMVFSGLAILFYMKFDQIMIKEILGVKQVGFYAPAVKLTEIWFFITVSIKRSLFPSIVSAKKKSEKLYYSRLQKLYQILVLIALCISVFTTLFSKEIIVIIFGKEYMPSSIILTIYVWSNIFIFLNNASWSWVINEQLQNLAAVRLILGAISNIVLNYYFIKSFGLVGAAYATLISYSIANYFGNLLFRETFINFKLQTKAIINVFNYRSYVK